MDTKLTVRQILFLFLFLSIGSILYYIPCISARNAGGTGYIAVIYSLVVLLIYAGLILQILKRYPNKNIYEVLQAVVGTILAKIIIIFYAVWAFIFVLMKIGAYSVALQATLMPSIHPAILIVILFLLVLYTLTKNERTIFRFAELLYQPIIAFLTIIFIFALPNFNFKELVPITMENLEANFYTVWDICSIGGNLVLLLFFCKKLCLFGDFQTLKKRVLMAVGMFCLISGLTVIMSIGINGPDMTSKLAYPIFQAVKSVSILNTFERFDSLLTMICMMSDFVAIVVFLQVTMLCLGWVFNYQQEEIPTSDFHSSKDMNKNHSLKVYGMTLFFIACVYILLRQITQYEFETFYEEFQIYLNLVFQFLIPVLLSIACILKQTVKKNKMNVTTHENTMKKEIY